MTDHDDIVTSRCVLLRQKGASETGLHTQQRKQICRNTGAIKSFRIAGTGEIEIPFSNRGHIRKNAIRSTELLKVDRSNRHTRKLRLELRNVHGYGYDLAGSRVRKG